MRTDSVNLVEPLALNTSKTEIQETWGRRNTSILEIYHTKTKGAQEAHEARPPTYINHHEGEGSSQEKRLYELIWKRNHRLANERCRDREDDGHHRNIGTSRKIYRHRRSLGNSTVSYVCITSRPTTKTRTAEGNSKTLLALANGRIPPSNGDRSDRTFHSNAPPVTPRHRLVRKLEELGIGRPSTYAPTISTIQQRDYVERGDRPGIERTYNTLTLKNGKITDKDKTEIVGAEKSKLLPTDIGIVVNDFLTEHFPDILNYNFTAQVEGKFDEVAEGKIEWNKSIEDFYELFHPVVEDALSLRLEHRVGERQLGTDPKSGRPVSVKIGRFGPLVQIGVPDDKEKPLFASLQKGQSINTITLEEASKLFEPPRNLGEYEGEVISVSTGRFGPDIRHNNKYVSLAQRIYPANRYFLTKPLLSSKKNGKRKKTASSKRSPKTATSKYSTAASALDIRL